MSEVKITASEKWIHRKTRTTPFFLFLLKHVKGVGYIDPSNFCSSLASDWLIRVNEPPGTEGRPITIFPTSVFSPLAFSLGVVSSVPFPSRVPHEIHWHASKTYQEQTILLYPVSTES